MTGRPSREVRVAADVTEQDILDACSMREPLYGENGDRPKPWPDVIDSLESYDFATDTYVDWGDSMESEAIRYLKREVNRRMKEAAE